MIKNYLKIAYRNLWRNRQFSLINSVGLALGIAVFLFIMEFVSFEWNANRYNKNFDQLHRVNLSMKSGGSDYYLPPGFGPIIKQQTPTVDEFVRVADGIASGVLTYTADDNGQSQVFRENDMVYADGNFLEVFSFPIVAGSKTFNSPTSLALEQNLSKKLFGEVDPIGKFIKVSNQFGNTLYTVNSVYTIPENSDIKSSAILSISTLENPQNRDGNDWADPNGVNSGFVNIYLQLKDGANPEQISQSLTNFMHNADPETVDSEIVLQPFRHLHLAPNFSYDLQTFGSLTMVVIFTVIALLILGIAWVNYINLSTAQALNRAQEVGVRKVLGANRVQLVFQYLTETLILTIIGTALAVLFVHLFQPMFNSFVDKPLSLQDLNSGKFLLAGVFMITAGSLLAGGYVAFVLSGFNPITVMRSKSKVAIKGLSLRKGLVVFQFTISIVLIVSTFVLYKQLEYMRNENLGMNLDQLLVIQGPTVSSEEQAAKNLSFKNNLAQLPFVEKYAASNGLPGLGYNFTTAGITRVNSTSEDDKKNNYAMFICDQNFFDTFGISFAQGKAFSQNDAERSWNNVRKVIINESAAKELGFDLNNRIIGEKISWGEPFEIIGVVKDYHHLSLREKIKPTIYLGSVSFSYFTIKTQARDLPSKIATIKEIYTNLFPGNPFEYFFADERFGQQYFADQKLGNVFIAAASMAIFIACLGLFGLAAFSARQRIKEIGVRKVLGASFKDIALLLSKDYVILVLISLLIATPVSWYAMTTWLQDFAYQTSISWWLFVGAGLIALFIALATVSFQAIKAAISNPVNSLRTE